MKTTIIFRQGGNNSRVGNSIVWIEKAHEWCKENGFEFTFLPGVEMFHSLFKDVDEYFRCKIDSFFLQDQDLYVKLFGRISVTLSNDLQDNKGLISIFPEVLGWIKHGSHSWDNEILISKLKKYRYVIVDEPYPFNTNVSISEFSTLKLKSDIRKLIHEHQGEIFATVHVRQGDYSKWAGGKHYRDNKYYNDILFELLEKCPPNKAISVVHNGEFVVDNKIKNKIYFPRYFEEFSPHLNDILKISISRNLIGPISTFSLFGKSLSDRAGVSGPNIVFFDDDKNIGELLTRLK